MRWPFSRRVTTVRIVGGTAEPPTRIAPSRPSEHDRLLAGLETAAPSWAVEVLGTLLRAIGAGHTLELIAAVDAWIEDSSTFCLVYAPPSRDTDLLVGIRCRRGDVDPHHPLYGSLDINPAELLMPDDPREYAEDTNVNISEPLGNVHGVLRFDAGGVGWWGTLDDALPVRPG